MADANLVITAAPHGTGSQFSAPNAAARAGVIPPVSIESVPTDSGTKESPSSLSTAEGVVSVQRLAHRGGEPLNCVTFFLVRNPLDSRRGARETRRDVYRKWPCPIGGGSP